MSLDPTMLDRIKRNIRLNYVYTALMSTTLDKAVWMLFLSFRGLGLVEIGLIESVFQLSSLVFGMPAGAVGDLLGRKVSLVLSVLAKIAGYLLILSSHGFAGFAAGFALNAVSLVLFQGASESLTYDSCKLSGQQVSYKRIYGNLLAVTFVATALGIAAGGLIASASYEWVYYASIVVLLGALVPALLLTETRDVAGSRARPGLAELFTRSAGLIAGNPLILYLLILSTTITVVDMTIYMYCQKYFEAMGIQTYLIGLIFSVDSIFAALGARYAYLLERLHNRDVIVLIPAAIVVMYVLLATINAPFVVLFLFVATVFVVGFWPILSELINARVPSENRATVLSMKSQMTSVSIMVVFPVVGFIADRSSLSAAFFWLVASATPLLIYSVVRVRKIAF